MPYYYLAESYYELSCLNALVKKLENIEFPLEEFKNDNYLPEEFSRIKRSAIRDLPIFGIHGKRYLDMHTRMVFDLVLRVMWILEGLPDYFSSNAKDRYLFQHCTNMKRDLRLLGLFYEDLAGA